MGIDGRSRYEGSDASARARPPCIAGATSVTVTGADGRERHPAELPLRMPKGQGAEGIDEPHGTVSVGFGMMEYPVARNKADSVRELQLWLAGILADTAGVGHGGA